MSLPKYSNYRDTRVDWLGMTPVRWEVVPLKRSARLVTERATTKRRPIALENLEGWSGRFIPTEGDFEGDGVAFEPNDILFGKLRPYLAKVYLADAAGEAVGDFHVIRPAPRLHPRYAQYQMLQREFIDIVDGSTFGSRMPRASWEALGGMPFVIPSYEEQDGIARFLDSETAKIDELIAEQGKLLTLLSEKRQATISHAVTCGLSPNAPMKDTGIPWLGEVPAHWDVTPVKHLGRLKGGAGFPHDEQGLADEALPFHKVNALAQSDVNGLIHRGENSISHETAKRLGAFVFPAKSIVFAKVGAALLMGRIRATAESACIDNNLMGLIVDETRYDVGFVRHALSLVRFDLIANPGAIPSLNESQIGEFKLAFPEQKEQRDVAAYLDASLRKLDCMTKEGANAIELLWERRSALIAAAVTGKIDVRNIVSRKAVAA